MIKDTELRIKGLNILSKSIGFVDTERFIALIIKEPFDYTQWQKNNLPDLSLQELSDKAMKSLKTDKESGSS
jgi:hypothetical protein